jgi:tRNA(fMet)-specific endonuclease VapC
MEAHFPLYTNMCIHIQRRRPPTLLARFSSCSQAKRCFRSSPMANSSTERRKADCVTKPGRSWPSWQACLLPVLALPLRAGELYGAIRASLEAAGDMIGNNDLWIAAHAKAAGLILVTNNEREFRRIQGLEIQNWAD